MLSSRKNRTDITKVDGAGKTWSASVSRESSIIKVKVNSLSSLFAKSSEIKKA